jgi:hypothetical protein
MKQHPGVCALIAAGKSSNTKRQGIVQRQASRDERESSPKEAEAGSKYSGSTINATMLDSKTQMSKMGPAGSKYLSNRARRSGGGTIGSSPPGIIKRTGRYHDLSTKVRDGESKMYKYLVEHATLPCLVTQTRDSFGRGGNNDDQSVRSKSLKQSVSSFALRLVEKTRNIIRFSDSVAGPSGILMPMLEGSHGPNSTSISSSWWSYSSSASSVSSVSLASYGGDTSGSSPSGSKPSEGPKDVSYTMLDSETQISKDPTEHATLPYLVTQTRDDLDGGDSNDDHSVRSKSSRQSVSRFAQRLVDKTRKTVSFSANVEGPGGIIMPMQEGRHGPDSISTSSSSLLWSCPSSASLSLSLASDKCGPGATTIQEGVPEKEIREGENEDAVNRKMRSLIAEREVGKRKEKIKHARK